MGIKLAIVGNGPSHKLFKGDFDVIIGCNYPKVNVDYSVFADCFSAKFMRRGEKHHDKVGKFISVLGERAFNGLNTIKYIPGGSKGLGDYYVDDLGGFLYKYESEFRNNSQHYFSSGHIAFDWGIQQFDVDEAHLFGFDSLFCGDHLATTSNLDVREWGEKSILERRDVENYSLTSLEWINIFKKLFQKRYQKFNSIVFHTFEGDKDPIFDCDKVSIIREKENEIL